MLVTVQENNRVEKGLFIRNECPYCGDYREYVLLKDERENAYIIGVSLDDCSHCEQKRIPALINMCIVFA